MVKDVFLHVFSLLNLKKMLKTSCEAGEHSQPLANSLYCSKSMSRGISNNGGYAGDIA